MSNSNNNNVERLLETLAKLQPSQPPQQLPPIQQYQSPAYTPSIVPPPSSAAPPPSIPIPTTTTHRITPEQLISVAQAVQKRPRILEVVQDLEQKQRTIELEWQRAREQLLHREHLRLQTAAKEQLPDAARKGIARKAQERLDALDRRLLDSLVELAGSVQQTLRDLHVPGFQPTGDAQKVLAQKKLLQVLLLLCGQDSLIRSR